MILKHAIDIEADPEKVWSVTEDVERWPDWSPTFDSIRRLDDDPFDLGCSVRVRQPGLPEAIWTVTQLERGRRFAWETKVRGMRMIGTHIMEPIEGGTRSILRLEIRGFTALLIAPLLRPAAARSLARENAGLKSRCERES